jgi:ethanolaminephosphotransferase
MPARPEDDKSRACNNESAQGSGLGVILDHALALALHRLLRAFNQTGDKWRHLPDLVDWLNQTECGLINEILLVLALAYCAFRFCSKSEQRKVTKFLTILATCLIYLQKHFPHLLLLPRLVYGLILGSTMLENPRERRQHLLQIVVLLACVLHTPANVICIGLLLCLLDILVGCRQILAVSPQPNFNDSYDVLGRQKALATVLMAKVAFFYLGNSNGLATVSVAAGYTGVAAYWPPVVGSLLAIHTYSGPLIVYAHYAATNGRTAAAVLAETYFYLAAGQAAVFSLLCTALRFHLFVWTVFSPKLLYMGMELIVTTAFFVVYVVVD